MFQLSIYGLIFLIAVAVLAVSGFYSRGHTADSAGDTAEGEGSPPDGSKPGVFKRRYGGKYPEMRLLRYCLIWSLACMGVSLLLVPHTAKILVHEAKFIGIAFLPPLILSLNLRIMGFTLTRKNLALLYIIPVITILTCVTNPMHSLFRRSLEVLSGGGILYVNPVGNYFYYLNIAYSFVIIVLTTLMLFVQQLKTPLFYRGWRWIIIVSQFIVIALDLLTVINIIPDHGDFVLLAFVPVYFAQYYALFLYHPSAMIRQERGTVISSMEDSVLFFGINGRLMDANASARNRHGITDEDLDALTIPAFFKRITGTDIPEETDAAELTLPSHESYNLSGQNVSDAKGRYVGRVLMLHDVTQMKRTKDELEHTLSCDALTGLFIQQVFREKAAAGIEPGCEFSLVSVGINNTKLINTTFGFFFGDNVIRFVADQIKLFCPSDGLCARMGGDEFLIFLPGYSLEQAEDIAAGITGACAASKEYFLPVMLSTGCAAARRGDGDFESELQSCADEMYKNKLLSRGRDALTIREGLMDALEAKGIANKEHLAFLARLCRRLGVAAGCREHTLSQLEQLAEMADIGFLSIDSDIIARRGRLSNEEWASWKLHVERSHKIARMIPSLSPISEDILSQHERYDGLGYPRRLQGEAIPLAARIYAICEAYAGWAEKNSGDFDAVALKKTAALSGNRFDPSLVSLFRSIF